MNVLLQNSGDISADVENFPIVGTAGFPIELSEQKQMEDELHSKLVEVTQHNTAAVFHHIPPRSLSGRGMWFTAPGPPLTDAELKNYYEGHVSVFILGLLRYHDEADTHKTTYCVFMNNVKNRVFQCSRYNEDQ